MIEIGEIWFDEQPTQPLPDVLVLRQRYAPPGGDDYTTQRSLVNDLTVSEDVLWSGLGNTCRYKIRRAKERDGVVCASFDQPTDHQIREFADFYAAFAKQKDLPRGGAVGEYRVAVPIRRSRPSGRYRPRQSHAPLE
jgi:CTP:molybdopterin cytidylyltransferase MocA